MLTVTGRKAEIAIASQLAVIERPARVVSYMVENGFVEPFETIPIAVIRDCDAEALHDLVLEAS